MTFLALDAVAKTYADGTIAVHGVDLAVDEGEFVVLLGPSGCGKTTTLRMVAGLERATGGSIQLAGKLVTDLSPSQRDVGFVFQFYALYPHLTVRDNLAFPLEAVGVPWRERAVRINEVAAAVGVTELLSALPRQLSGGDQQRVSLARALIRRPRLWLMDEPLGTLDAAVRASLGAFIHEQQRRHRVTTLFVTHDQEEAMQLADRVVVMEAGRIRQVGTPTDIHDAPRSRFVAHFVGSPGMNFIPAIRTAQGLCLADGRHLTVQNVAATDVLGPVIVGVRPQWLQVTTDESEKVGIVATVVLDEYQGDHRLLHVDAAGLRLVARIPATQRHALGARVILVPHAEGIRLFDLHSGAAR